MSPTLAPSFCACLTEEFMNTVQRVPRSTGALGKQTQPREFLHTVAHGFGESLNEGAAPGGACLVEHDGVDGVVADLEAFDVLPADVEDEVHVGIEVARRR